MKETKLPDSEFSGKNLSAGAPLISIGGYSIMEWTPELNGKGKPEMVFLILHIPEIEPAQLCLRFKGPVEITRMIEGLTKYRDSVWPKDS